MTEENGGSTGPTARELLIDRHLPQLLSGHGVNAVRLHVYGADALVRLGVDRDDFK